MDVLPLFKSLLIFGSSGNCVENIMRNSLPLDGEGLGWGCFGGDKGAFT